MRLCCACACMAPDEGRDTPRWLGSAKKKSRGSRGNGRNGDLPHCFLGGIVADDLDWVLGVWVGMSSGEACPWANSVLWVAKGRVGGSGCSEFKGWAAEAEGTKKCSVSPDERGGLFNGSPRRQATGGCGA